MFITCVPTAQMDLPAAPPEVADGLCRGYEKTLREVDLPALRAFAAAASPLAEAAAWPSPLVQGDTGGGHAWAQLPHPARGQMALGAPFEHVGVATAPYKPPGMAQTPAYAGSHVWRCTPATIPQLLKFAQGEASSLSKVLLPAFRGAALKAGKAASRQGPGSDAANEAKEADEYANLLMAPFNVAFNAVDDLGVSVGVPEVPIARFSFWSRVTKVIMSVKKGGADFVVIVPPDPRRMATAKWVRSAELLRAFGDATGAAWEAMVAARMAQFRAATGAQVGKLWPCIADRTLLLAQGGQLPTFYAEGSAEASAVDYFVNLAQVGLAGRDDPVFKQSWRSIAAREAIPNLQWAAGELASGRMDPAAMARLDGSDEEGLDQKIADFWRVNHMRLKRVLDVAAERPELTVAFADCTEVHKAGPAAR